MYLVFALLAPIALFGLLPGLAWFEERMLGPGLPRSLPGAEPEAKTTGTPADTAPATEASAETPVVPALPTGPAAATVTPIAAAAEHPDADRTPPIPLQPVPPPVRTAPHRHRLRRPAKHRRGLRAA
ncbi:hypothetical protein ACU686_02935 [Yinghuangia aomiensis]